MFPEDAPVFYVNTGSRHSAQKGTEDNPFTSLEQAVTAAYEYAHRQKEAPLLPVTIYLLSDVSVEEAVFLTLPVRIKGRGTPVLSFGDNAGFVIEKTFFEISGCTLKRSEWFTEPRMVPVLYGGQSSIVLNNVLLTVTEGGEAVLLRGSRLFCTDCVFTSKQSAQAVLIRSDTGFVSAVRSSFAAEGLNALCFELSDSECTVADIRCSLLPHYTGRAAELVRSNLQVSGLEASYASPLFSKMDTAVLADKQSKITVLGKPVLQGFTQAVLQRK